MENQTQKEVSHSKSSSSVPGSGSYIPLERPKKSGGLKNLLMAGLVLASLAGGYYAYQKSVDLGSSAQIEMQQESAREMINLVLGMSEEDNDTEGQKKIAQAIKGHLEEKRKLDSKLNDVAVVDQPESIVQSEKKKQVSPLSASQLGFFKGILTRCYISGHDVHWINDSGMILEHVDFSTPLHQGANAAREIINSEKDRVVVVVYEKGYEVYKANGELVKTSQP